MSMFFVLSRFFLRSSMEPRGGLGQVLSKNLPISSAWRLQSDSTAEAPRAGADNTLSCVYSVCSALRKLSSFIQVSCNIHIIEVPHLTFMYALFRDKLPNRDDPKQKNSTLTKVTINDVLYSSSQCHDNFDTWTYVLIIIGSIFWIFRAITSFFQVVHNWDIKSFFNVALKIEDIELENYTWHEVQRRIRQAQSEMQLCIHKENLTELDIYHRILRYVCANVQLLMLCIFHSFPTCSSLFF